MAFSIMPELGAPVQLADMGETFSQSGIYFLWQGDTVVYVGQSRHMTRRILQHVADGVKRFDGVSNLPCERKLLLRRERFYIESLLPQYNRCGLSQFVRKAWTGHMGERPVPDKTVGRKVAAAMLGVTIPQLQTLAEHGLTGRKIRVPRCSARRTIYSVRDLHQFAAQKGDKIIASRELA